MTKKISNQSINETRFLWAISLVVFLNLVAHVFAEQKNVEQGINMTTENTISQTKLFATKLVFTADHFRMKAADKISDALSQFGSENCRNLWEKNFKSLFDSSEIELADFFSNAIILVGCIENFHATVAYYNPWSDTMCITEWKGENDSKMLNLIFLTGDTWRGESIDSNALPLPIWQRSGKTIARALQKPYMDTVSLFDITYPIFGGYKFLPDRLKGIDQAKFQEKEIALIRQRISVRMLMFKEFIEAKPDTTTGLLRNAARNINELIAAGKKEELSGMIKGKQDSAMLDSIFIASEDTRKRFSYNCIMLKGKRGIVTLANPRYPQWFIVLYIDINDENKTWSLDSIEMYKFELLKNLDATANERMSKEK